VPAFRALAISDRTSLADGDLAAWLGLLAQAGQAESLAVQIREKDLDDRALYGLTRLARAALPPAVRLLVNGRIDVALAAGADGAHLPADGPPVGLDALARVARLGIPVYALGGVTLDRLGEVASAGAAGVAGIRLFQPPFDLEDVLRSVRRSFPA
jgi:thiamine-phosphate pyrophosphorylase